MLIGVFLKGLNDNLQDELGNRDKSEPNPKELTSQAIYVDKRLRDRHREKTNKSCGQAFFSSLKQLKHLLNNNLHNVLNSGAFLSPASLQRSCDSLLVNVLVDSEANDSFINSCTDPRPM